ncbi:MAG: lysophospholipase [Oscillospiraceae bacterium]|jgi:alpha-beta hydrolase superfamily lysophospholipase|nr:lysophospholipase [Oscillospiraceae bacterium]
MTANRQILLIPSSYQGETLHTVVWNAENPKAILFIAHGMAEHIMRYDDFARYLSSNGIAVAGCSHLGHGLTSKSEDDLGYISKKNGWSNLIADQAQVRAKLESLYPGVPVFMFGHSMGSFAARTYITETYASGLRGVIICGTGHEPPIMSSVGKKLAGIVGVFRGSRYRSKLLHGLSIGRYNSKIKSPRTEVDWLSFNEDNVDAYIADSRCGFNFTVNGYKSLFEGINYVSKMKNIRKADSDLPVLFIAGSEDPVGNCGKGVAKVSRMFKKAGMKNVAVKIYDNMRHEILNEDDRATVYSDVAEFIDSTLSI